MREVKILTRDDLGVVLSLGYEEWEFEEMLNDGHQWTLDELVDAHDTDNRFSFSKLYSSFYKEVE